MISFRRVIPIILVGWFCAALAPLMGAQQFPKTLYQEMRWRSIGPLRGGRTKAVSGVRQHALPEL